MLLSTNSHAERNRRTRNILLHNIPEPFFSSVDENWRCDMATTLRAFKPICTFKPNDILILTVPPGAPKPGIMRPIRVSLPSPDDAIHLLRNKRKVRIGYISGDLTPLQARQRQKLREEMESLKKQGIFKRFKYINNHVTLVDDETAGTFDYGRSVADRSSALQAPRSRDTPASSVGQSLASNNSMEIGSPHNVISNASFIDTQYNHNDNLPSPTIPVEASNQRQFLSQPTNSYPLPLTSAPQPLSQQLPVRAFARRGRPRKNALNQAHVAEEIDLSAYTPPSNLNIQYGFSNARGGIKRKDTSNLSGFQFNGQATKRGKSTRGRDGNRGNKGGQ